MEVVSSRERIQIPLPPRSRRRWGLDHSAPIGRLVRQLRQMRKALHDRVTLTERIFSEAPGCIFVLDTRYVFRDVNAFALRALDRSRKEIVGRRLEEVAGDETPRLREYLDRIQKGEAVSIPDFRATGATGQTTVWEARGVALPDEHGRPDAILVLACDVTTRARHAAELEEANRSREYFFNTLSHELRTPLSAILNGVRLLQRPGATAEHRVHAQQIIERNARHQARLVDDLLDLSRITHGKITLDLEELDLREVVRTQADSFEAEALARHLAWKLELSDIPLRMWGDQVRISQVIGNLLSNAIRYSEPGGQVVIQAGDDGAGVFLRVQDSGIGIDEGLLPHVFEPFRQADTSLARTRGGLGIGLAIVRALVEHHGGQVEAHSAGIGQGSSFRVRFPRYTGARTSGRTPQLPVRIAGHRVLVVEDNADLRTSLVSLLQLEQCTVFTAANGLQALELLEHVHPEVVLLDIGLPDIDGYQLAPRIRACPGQERIVLIALTGYAGAQHRQRALEAGFDAHAAKPLDLPALLRLIQDALSGHFSMSSSSTSKTRVAPPGMTGG